MKINEKSPLEKYQTALSGGEFKHDEVQENAIKYLDKDSLLVYLNKKKMHHLKVCICGVGWVVEKLG